MIIDKLENASKYFNIDENLKKGFEYLLNTDFQILEDGKYQIYGDDVYASVQTYMTKDETTADWELHNKYTDIQYVVSGIEKIGWSNKDNYSITIPYNAEKDISFGKVQNGNFVVVPQGYFVVFTPEDTHKPSLNFETSKKVKKVVVKVL